jgi:hypothetical protein
MAILCCVLALVAVFLSSKFTAGSATPQTMLGTMACSAKNSEVISTTNAGKLVE